MFCEKSLSACEYLMSGCFTSAFHLKERMKEIEMYTEKGQKFYVSFSDDPPDFKKLAKFFLLLSQKKEDMKND